MPAYRISKLEMKALEYIANMPEIDDSLLADALKIKESEVKKLRTKLSKILQWVVVPNYGKLGWELMFVVYSTMPPRKIPPADALEGCTHAYTSPEYFFATGFAQNYAELLRLYEKLCIDLKMQKDHLHLLIFSHELTQLLRFFDYQEVLGKIAGNWETGVRDAAREEGKALDPITRKILFEIVHHPAADVETLSALVGIEKSTVRRKRSFLKKQEYLRPAVSVNLKALGYAGFAFYHLTAGECAGKGWPLDATGTPPFFAVADRTNAFLLVPYTRLDEIFQMSVALTTSSKRMALAVSIVNYGYFQFGECRKLRENDYISVLKRSRNFMFGDKVESAIGKPERRSSKINPGNRR
ncbi:MAG: hypothetical protein N3F63_07135 [Thermoplasmata archaeon]|nr:hypothetical protein [Thermoplasmata archaeon]